MGGVEGEFLEGALDAVRIRLHEPCVVRVPAEYTVKCRTEPDIGPVEEFPDRLLGIVAHDGQAHAESGEQLHERDGVRRRYGRLDGILLRPRDDALGELERSGTGPCGSCLVHVPEVPKDVVRVGAVLDLRSEGTPPPVRSRRLLDLVGHVLRGQATEEGAEGPVEVEENRLCPFEEGRQHILVVDRVTQRASLRSSRQSGLPPSRAASASGRFRAGVGVVVLACTAWSGREPVTRMH
ncbi:hypothetical protein ADL12_13105 [Streptomyces regalis]|uniref:Uncharacterized protein n=1 Tax=Streptomyces regalis TaxID=68262 RepID=A0A0X3V6Q6_9ACTN|nr:hypothetical protein ADL12_13105 [Streptomyces regalis]